MKTLLFTLAAAIAASFAPTCAMANPLDGLRGEKRVLLLFAKSRSDASLDRQVDVLREYRSELAERDLIVLRTAGREETRAAIGYTSLNNGSARQLRARFMPAESRLTVVLVGKDGGEKQRWSRVVEPEEIFATIDAMPMRQREMQEADGS